MDRFSELVMAPMVNALCGKVAQTIMNGAEGGVCNLVANFDGTGAIISPTMDQFTGANAVLDDQGATMMDRRCVQDPTSDARTVSSLAGLLNPVTEISSQFRSGMMKSGLGYDRFFRDQTVIKHTTGTFSAGGSVNGGNQSTATSGGSITVNAITGTFKKGDIVTIANVNAVNRVTKQSLGTLRQFVVTADVATTATSLPLYPGIIGPVGGAVGGLRQIRRRDAGRYGRIRDGDGLAADDERVGAARAGAAIRVGHGDYDGEAPGHRRRTGERAVGVRPLFADALASVRDTRGLVGGHACVVCDGLIVEGAGGVVVCGGAHVGGCVP
jgi:hypothetical protein